MSSVRAEVISIGDELTSGSLLDTNTPWISRQLRASGIDVAFHTTVGDDLADNIAVFLAATRRADLIISTGGLGPTADDLTRNAIAEMAQVKLVKDERVLERIELIYQRRGLEMPSNNAIQAFFPEGSVIIDNPEGTAPGIDYSGSNSSGSPYRIMALPGVPAEMKQMWDLSVGPAIKKQLGAESVFHQHTIRCFGAGESQIELMLPDLVRRGRDPQVGITASAATISLCLSTFGQSKQHCLEKMQPTIAIIESNLGDYVFGVSDEELQCVVVELLQARGQTVSIIDAGLNGSVAKMIEHRASDHRVLLGDDQVSAGAFTDARSAAHQVAMENCSNFGVAIGAVDRGQEQVDAGESYYQVAIVGPGTFDFKEIQFVGHSSYREVKAAKEVLNFLRLHLLKNNLS